MIQSNDKNFSNNKFNTGNFPLDKNTEKKYMHYSCAIMRQQLSSHMYAIIIS
jgi:hypothetical protein